MCGEDFPFSLKPSVVPRRYSDHPDRREAAVPAIRARVLLPDSPHAAAGDDWMAVIRWDPKPPADVLSVGAVTQGGGMSLADRGRQRVLVEEDGLQQRTAQHQLSERRRRGDAGAVALPAAQLLLWDDRGSAAGTFTPAWGTAFGVGVRFLVLGRLKVMVHADVRL